MPARFRSNLGEHPRLTKGIHGCVFLYHDDEYKALAERLSKQKQYDENTLRLQRWFTCMDANIDPQGRLTIPATLKSHAGIEEESILVMIGTGKKVEIWAKSRYDAHIGSITDEMITSSWKAIEEGELVPA